MSCGMNRREFLKRTATRGAAISAAPAIILGRAGKLSAHPTGEVPQIDRAAIRKLAAELRGGVLLPGDAGYAPACQNWAGQLPLKPGLAVQCTAAGDVMAAIKFARDRALPLAVRSFVNDTGTTE